MASSHQFLLLLTILSLASCATLVTVTNCSDYLYFLSECHRNTNDPDFQLRKATFERKCLEIMKQNEDKAKGLTSYTAAFYCEYGDLPEGQECTSMMTQHRSG
jgi:hypothetical protein